MAQRLHTAHTWPEGDAGSSLFQRLYRAVTGLSTSHNGAYDDMNISLSSFEHRSPSPGPIRNRLNSHNSALSHDADKRNAAVDGVTVVRPHKGRVLLRYWIHALAIIITAAFAAINFMNIYLMDVDDHDSQVTLGAFQFVAKFHELTILGSLVMVIMDMIRSQLTQKSGVPLGLLLSNVLFTDLEWLISSNFWSSLGFRRQSLPLTLLVLVSIPFANLAGPLSAITIVPRLNWSQRHPAQIFPRFYNASATRLWPDTATALSLPQECFENFAERVFQCPSSVLMGQASYGPDLACTSSGLELSCNGTMVTTYSGSNDQDGPISRPMSAELNINENTVYASTPVRLIYQDLVALFSSGVARTLNISDTEAVDALKIQLIETNFLGEQQVFKPLVKAQCSELGYAEAKQMIAQRKLPNTFSRGDVTILEDIDGTLTPKLLYTVDRRSTTFTYGIRGECQGDDCFAAFTCTAEARWVPFKVWYNTAQASIIFQDHPQPKETFESQPSGTRPIVIKKDWLNAMIHPQGDLNDTFASFDISLTWPGWSGPWTPVFAGQPSKPSSNHNLQEPYQASNYTQAQAMQFAIVLTEALARLPSFAGNTYYDGNCSNVYTDGFTFDKEICAQDPSHWIHADSLGDSADRYSAITFTVRRSGYRWGLDSALVTVSLAALLLHALLTLIYLIAVLLFRRQITTCWESAPEMFLLAISSLKAPVLMGHSAGVSRHNRHLWHERVTVRETAGGEELSLVVGDPEDYGGEVGDLPSIGKKYN